MSPYDPVSSAAPIRVLVVDDHPLLRAGLAETIAAQPDMCVAGEAGDGRAAVDAFAACRPDVTIMDIAMPDMCGVTALQTIRHDFSHARVLMLTTYKGDAQIRRALQAGASGFLLKSSVRKDLLDAVRAVHAGLRHVPSEIAMELAQHMGDAMLSDRETEVLRCAAAGNSNKRIALQLAIAEETVKAHMRTILSKLGANDRTHAVTLALKRGFLSL
ncbi:response regulator transcription factor [Pseudoduganella ginsengisoli]|uniref:response regulator transcription factor n=1 Tax=Pseudoduganella ginsengisoli TaxID=1462440 RepID=UPI0035305A07